MEGIIFMLRKGMFLADRYEIIEQIGTGGMSDVYKAKCHKLNRFVAIKVMKSEFSEDKTFVSKFRAEAQSVAGFTHPNIVNVYDVGDENGIYYIVMELVEGITLKKYIEKRGRIPFKEAVSIAIQVANGLDAAHKHNIVHRDIKPQNIIISKEGKVKVTDFGIAKVASSSTINSSSTMGSVHYISPEQARGGYSDARSDLYSLGITIFEMLTGTVPFDGDSTVTDDIPLSIDRIVLKLTQKKPDRRYQTAAELITDLKKSLVMPDTDFVVMAPLYGASGSASQVMPANNNSVKDEDDNLSDDDFLDDSEDEEDDEQSKNELEDDSDDSDIDDENNDKLDLIMKIIGIGIAVIILIVTIFIIVKLVGSTKSNKNNNESTQTTESSIEQTSTSADDKNKVTVPKVEGMTKDDAIKALNEVGLGYRAVVQNSDRVSEGTVISQGTAAGKKVAKNTQIIITISGGKEVKNITVPSVTGKTESEARTALEADGFVVDVDYQYSSTVENGKVIKASPSGSVAQGSTITITVSRGKEIKNVTMANLIGKTESEAKQWIDSNGLKYSVKYTTTSGTYGNVVSCDYSEGTSVPEGTTVTITVSHKQETTTKATEADKNNNTNQGGSSNNNSNGNNNANGNNSDSNNQPKNAEQKSQN